MYGSQFHLEQALNTKRFSTSQLERNFSVSTPSKKKNWIMVGIIFIILTATTSSFAGPSQSKLAGGNGNANGR